MTTLLKEEITRLKSYIGTSHEVWARKQIAYLKLAIKASEKSLVVLGKGKQR